MGEEAQKRNTDCVYFLASPLTCKKGTDCEYRHSEAARVNPRDCWYWLSGNCLNANCSFRHPPLDGRMGAGPSSSTGGSAAAPASGVVVESSSAVQPAPSTSKSAVPCFFFSQGFCSKGSKCAFLHGPPTHFKKEAMTYRKPSEQLAAAEGNGLSFAIAQVQEGKQPPLVHSPAKAAGFTPSNVYKLSAHGGGPSSSSTPSGKQPSEKTDQASKMRLIHGGVENSRHGQSVGGRVPQVHVRDESLEQVPPAERVVGRDRPLQLDLSRGLQREGRSSNTIHNAYSSEGLVSSEIQEWASEEAHHLTRGLHARDLRNHLKRKRNEMAFASRNFNGREHPKDRLESGRLASRAVVVGDFTDFVASSSSISKGVMQDKEVSTFTGPKSLAQIKAEKSKAEIALENSGGQSRGDDLVAEVKREESPRELRENSAREACESGKQNLVDKPILKEDKALEVKSKEDSDPGRESKVYSQKPVVPSSSELVPNKAVGEAGSWPGKKQREEKLTANVVGTKVVSDSGVHSHISMDTSEGNGTEVGYYSSADELIEDDGAEALEDTLDAEYLSDYEEDDFAKKLSSFA